MLHKRKYEYQNREIETFKLTPEYYIETWVNGNKKHVAEELSELLVCTLGGFIDILCDLPEDMQKFILNSDYFSDADFYLKTKGLGGYNFQAIKHFKK